MMNLSDWTVRNDLEFAVKTGMSYQTEVLYILLTFLMSSIVGPIKLAFPYFFTCRLKEI
jgi:hypothetical protein